MGKHVSNTKNIYTLNRVNQFDEELILVFFLNAVSPAHLAVITGFVNMMR